MAAVVRKGQRWLWYTPLAVLGILFVGGGMVYLEEEPQREVERLRREISSDLPPGTSRGQVERWLRDHQMQPRDVLDARGRASGLFAISPWQPFWTWNGSLEIWFSFDETDRLTGQGVEWSSYAP